MTRTAKEDSVTNREIAYRRLWNQQITATDCDTPSALVRRLGAMQAQDFLGVLWAIGLRLPGATETVVESAFTAGSVLRTHLMRPTWHFVVAEDIHWLLDLTAPRVKAAVAGPNRVLELDDAVFARCAETFRNALAGGRNLTRNELGAALAQAGIVAEARRLNYIMMHMELDGVVCSGPRRGKQFTYALLDERVPPARRLERDEALAELVRRYFSTRGPAQIRDFTGWSGLTAADTRAGFEMLKPEIEATVIGGRTYYQSAFAPPVATAPPALLLPPFDEYTIAYKDHGDLLDPAHAEQAKMTIYSGLIVISGEVAGNWKRSLKRETVEITFAPFRPLSAGERDALAVEAQRYGDYLGLRAVVVV